ncbi:MAG: META domain-containing protein [Desulfobulbus sp.]|nr:META domain-containing protein [Desulfobulbus sp.]
MRADVSHTLSIPLPLLLVLLFFLLAACAQEPRQGKPLSGKATHQGLEWTSWQLSNIQPMPKQQPITRVKEPGRYTLQFLDEGRVSLRLNCNRGMGQWQSIPVASGKSGQLKFGPIAMTRMRCPPPSLDERIARDLSVVRSYLLRDGKLYLSLMADGGIYEWQPIRKQP